MASGEDVLPPEEIQVFHSDPPGDVGFPSSCFGGFGGFDVGQIVTA